jgi:hypothetical protein
MSSATNWEEVLKLQAGYAVLRYIANGNFESESLTTSGALPNSPESPLQPYQDEDESLGIED